LSAKTSASWSSPFASLTLPWHLPQQKATETPLTLTVLVESTPPPDNGHLTCFAWLVWKSW